VRPVEYLVAAQPAVGEAQLRPDPPGWQAQPVLPEQSRRAGGAADHRPQRRQVR
jgi:hypothetical protein